MSHLKTYYPIFCLNSILVYDDHKNEFFNSYNILILDIFLCFSLANVDPIDIARNITGLNPETTLGLPIFFSPYKAWYVTVLIIAQLSCMSVKLWWSQRRLQLLKLCWTLGLWGNGSHLLWGKCNNEEYLFVSIFISLFVHLYLEKE